MGDTPRFLPIARGPLVDLHRRSGARLDLRQGWEVAVQYPAPTRGSNRICDFSHRTTIEMGGRRTGIFLAELCGTELPPRRIHTAANWSAYRLNETRGLVFGNAQCTLADSIDVTAGWASLALCGCDAASILSKVTALDLRDVALPVSACAQAPLFGVNTLFGRFEHGFELHLCGDSAAFIWEVLLDAGAEFGLSPAGCDEWRWSEAHLQADSHAEAAR